MSGLFPSIPVCPSSCSAPSSARPSACIASSARTGGPTSDLLDMSISAALMLGSFFLWAAMGMPIGFAMLAAAFLYLLSSGQDIGLVASQSLNGLFRSFVLLAVPLFIVAAAIMH